MITPKQSQEIHDIIVELVTLKTRCFKAGLLRTGHEMDKATTEVGWEFADILQGKQVIP